MLCCVLLVASLLAGLLEPHWRGITLAEWPKLYRPPFGQDTPAPVEVIPAEPALTALKQIATRAIPERNPDGEDQSAESMQLIARGALAEILKPEEWMADEGEEVAPPVEDGIGTPNPHYPGPERDL